MSPRWPRPPPAVVGDQRKKPGEAGVVLPNCCAHHSPPPTPPLPHTPVSRALCRKGRPGDEGVISSVTSLGDDPHQLLTRPDPLHLLAVEKLGLNICEGLGSRSLDKGFRAPVIRLD